MKLLIFTVPTDCKDISSPVNKSLITMTKSNNLFYNSYIFFARKDFYKTGIYIFLLYAFIGVTLLSAYKFQKYMNYVIQERHRILNIYQNIHMEKY